MTQPHREHREHRFTRVVATADDGRVLFGCAHGRSEVAGCAEVEVRRPSQPSPFALRRAAAKQAAERRRQRRGP